MDATFANCFVNTTELGSRFFTDEISVAATAPRGTHVSIVDELIDPDRAQAMNTELWNRAYSWFRDGEHDPTLVDGISAGDIAGAEAALTIFSPAARGVLEAQALGDADNLEELTLVVPEGGPGHYDQVERIQAEAFGAALGTARELAVRRVVSRDPRNGALFAKFQRTRDPDWIASESGLRVRARDLVVGAANLGSTLRDRRNALAVLEYNPTRAFARAYAADPRRALRLVRFDPSPGDLWNICRAGDRAALLRVPSVRGRHAASAAIHATASAECWIGGVALTAVIEPYLGALVDRHASLIRALAPRLRDELKRSDVKALFVPFDTPPLARLLVRVAQILGIPSLHLNDGFKADNFQPDGTTADRALAWSESIRANYYRPRRRDAPVTGNPKADAMTGNPEADAKPHQRRWRTPRTRLLVGGFTFSPIDLNCRRSDPETFLDNVLEGIRMSSSARPRVTVKLHPADEIAHYGEILSKFAELEPEIVSHGDVSALFDAADVYITTYSTSLLEAMVVELRVVYYRVNSQRLHAPFAGDAFLEQRTAGSPKELAALLDEPPAEFATREERLRWCERYLGPLDGRSVDRVLTEIEKFAHIAVRT